VGSRFNAEEFAGTLKRNHVDSINLFGKCHHGFYYYPTKLGRVHPTLKGGLDLLGGQIKACRAEGIRSVIYTTVVWAEDTCDAHPEWMQVDTEGRLGGKPPFTNNYNTGTGARSWRSLCLNNPGYLEYLRREFKEMIDLYHPDGLWIDIIWQFDCICPHCLGDMKKQGLDPEKTGDVRIHNRQVEIKFTNEMYRYIKGIDKNCGVYFNGFPAEFDEIDCPELSTARRRDGNDFIDIESLPSDAWGYSHFPILVNYVNRFDKPVTMMNGKFHKSWGDFGTLRNRAALEYECFRALAYGAGVCVGDQLHPTGKLDETVYRHIGGVFEEIERKEPWCKNTKKISQIGVYASNKTMEDTMNNSNEGVYRMLTELHYLFDFIDFEDEVEGYGALVLPDTVRLSPAAAARISAYLSNGGKLLLTGESGLAPGGGFALSGLGLSHLGEEEYSPAYAAIRSEDGFFTEIPSMDYAVYQRGQRVNAGNNKVLARLTPPYFNRSWEHFCSHRQTPPRPDAAEYPFAAAGENFIYVSHPLFWDYAVNGCKVHKDIIAACLKRLVREPLVKVSGPSTLELTLRKKDKSRILHLLHYIPMRRCKTIDIIEDVIPLYHVAVEVKAPARPAAVYLAPEKTALDFTYSDGYVTCTLPELKGHQMLVLED
jgi:hypothetical protein